MVLGFGGPERGIDAVAETGEGGASLITQGGVFGFGFFELVGEAQGGKEQGMRIGHASWGRDFGEFLFDDERGALQLVIRCGGDDFVVLAADSNLDRASCHDLRTISRKWPGEVFHVKQKRTRTLTYFAA